MNTNYRERLATFAVWQKPFDFATSKMTLAKQGYFYNKLSKTIECHRCQRVINDSFDITHHASQCMGGNNHFTDASNMVTEGPHAASAKKLRLDNTLDNCVILQTDDGYDEMDTGSPVENLNAFNVGVASLTPLTEMHPAPSASAPSASAPSASAPSASAPSASAPSASAPSASAPSASAPSASAPSASALPVHSHFDEVDSCAVEQRLSEAACTKKAKREHSRQSRHFRDRKVVEDVKEKLMQQTQILRAQEELVRSLQDENSRYAEQHSCRVCLSKEISTVLTPCGHVCCCDDCAPQMYTCPVCRAPVQAITRIYFP